MKKTSSSLRESENPELSPPKVLAMTSCSFADLDIALDSWDFGHMIQPFRKDLLPAMVSHHGRHGHLFQLPWLQRR